MKLIPDYPVWSQIELDMREILHPLFLQNLDGISEFAFSNIFLFRRNHNYRISCIDNKTIVICGRDDDKSSYFILPFGLPDDLILDELFNQFDFIKLVSENQAQIFEAKGLRVQEDTDNFDYLYLREELATLPGRKFHKKRNHVNTFISSYTYTGKPILPENIVDAIAVLDAWRKTQDNESDYAPALEALENSEELQLCGSILYVLDKPVAYTMGEEIAGGKTFVIHFEKAVNEYKGAYQFINYCFASMLPDKYEIINREQDLGDEGLRHSKMSYQPCGFIKKYKVFKE